MYVTKLGVKRFGIAVVAIVALGVGACSPPPGPGLGEIMTLNQMRHAKLWFAGEARNWNLADYELDELQEGFDDVVTYHPTHKDSPLPLSELVPKIMSQPMQSLRQAIEAKDTPGFEKSFDDLTAACNSCHQATEFGFNVVKRPEGLSWFSNQDFEPPP
jgi:hypothetical protein